MLVTDGREVELHFAVSSLLRVGAKSDRVGTILDADEKQNSGLLIAEASDFVFTGGERPAGGYERKRHFHQELIRLLGLGGNGEASEAGQDQESAQD